MKSNEQFLEQMWDDIALIEQEELQKQIAREKTMKQIKQNIIKYISTIFIFVLLTIITIFDKTSFTKNIILPLSLILLIVGYLFENPLQSKIIVIRGILLSWIQ